ncbi:MAG: hypothetical protein ACRDRL_30460 [Sciscionella sp.]
MGWRQRRTPQAGQSEEWEVPVAADLATHLNSGVQPFRPRHACEAPVDAVSALSELVGVRCAADLLVVPAAVYRVDDYHRYAPTQVLGMGATGIALWVDDLPFERIVGAATYEEILLVEHVIESPDCARLTLLTLGGRLTVRYAAAGWPTMAPLLNRVRARVLHFEHDGALRPDELAEIPIQVGMGTIRASVSTHSERRRRRLRNREVWPATRAVLTEHEFVVLRNPPAGTCVHHRVDLLAVPRSKLTAIACTDSELCVHAGVTHRWSVGPQLVHAVKRDLLPVLIADLANGEPVLDPVDPSYHSEPGAAPPPR